MDCPFRRLIGRPRTEPAGPTFWTSAPTAPATPLARSSQDSAESDETGNIDDGTLILSQIWVPTEGTLTLYVTAAQEGVEGHLHGSADLSRHGSGDELGYRAKQHFDQKTVTTSEALALASQYGMKIVAGGMGAGLMGSAELKVDLTDTSTTGSAEMVSVRIPLPALDLTRLT